MMKWISKIGGGFKTLFDNLCLAEPAKSRRWILVVFLIGLYAAGFVWFGKFFDWGNHKLTFQDWAEITAPRYQFLKTAMKAGEIPYNISDSSPLHEWTQRFLVVPDTFFSPQMVLLRSMTIPFFNLVNIWLSYSLGFLGLLCLRSRLRLSVIAFTPLFLLFNFNGHILAHLAIGHETWSGYFLFPWFIWLALRLVDGDRSWKWTLEMAVLLFVIWLQGAFHQYVWLLIMLGLLGIFIPRTFWSVVRAGIFTDRGQCLPHPSGCAHEGEFPGILELDGRISHPVFIMEFPGQHFSPHRIHKPNYHEHLYTEPGDRSRDRLLGIHHFHWHRGRCLLDLLWRVPRHDRREGALPRVRAAGGGNGLPVIRKDIRCSKRAPDPHFTWRADDHAFF